MKFLRALYFSNRFFTLAGSIAALCVVGFFIEIVFPFAKILFLLLVAAALADVVLLFSSRLGVKAVRHCPERLSNGDENQIHILLQSFFRFPVLVFVIDEIPHQFQVRDMNFPIHLTSGETQQIDYSLRPVKRGEYDFGGINLLISSVVGMATRRIIAPENKLVPVYPSFLQMRKYELLAISNNLTNTGIKRIRRIGQNLEFEQIKKYTAGDDIRSINWKATARKGDLMVNNFQDERSQQVYSLIDKGRVMKMPFNGMSLLDYAINASLVISNIAIKKSDKAGLITFQDKIGTILSASRINKQMSNIMDILYNQKTAYRESDFSVLYATIRRRITQRSLLLLFTNFETNYSLKRQLPYLKNLAHQHLLVVVFFENTEMKTLIEKKAADLESIYYKAVAEKFSYEKKLIVKELRKNGIQALLTTPEKLTVNTINKYLELKARNLI